MVCDRAHEGNRDIPRDYMQRRGSHSLLCRFMGDECHWIGATVERVSTLEGCMCCGWVKYFGLHPLWNDNPNLGVAFVKESEILTIVPTTRRNVLHL